MAIETYQLAIQGVHGTEYVETILHFEGTGVDPANTSAAGISLIAGFRANCETQWLAAFPASYQIRQYAARRASSANSNTVWQSFAPGALSGTHASSTGCADQLCPCISWVPPLGTKSGGRTFLPVVPLGAIVSNSASAGYQTILTTLITAILTAFSNAGISWVKVILSRKLNTSSAALAGNLSLRLGYQKRRRSPLGAGV